MSVDDPFGNARAPSLAMRQAQPPPSLRAVDFAADDFGRVEVRIGYNCLAVVGIQDLELAICCAVIATRRRRLVCDTIGAFHGADSEHSVGD